MILLIVIGVAGMAALVFVISKVLHTGFGLSFATALTALYGFPMNAIITESTCNALAETEEEKKYLMGQIVCANDRRRVRYSYHHICYDSRCICQYALIKMK